MWSGRTLPPRPSHIPLVAPAGTGMNCPMQISPRRPWCHALLSATLLALLAGCSEKPAEPKSAEANPGEAAPRGLAPASVVPGAAAKSAVPNSFDEVAAQLDPGGNLYGYLSTERWLAGLSQQLAGLGDAIAPPATASKEERENYRRGFAMLIEGLQRSGLEQLTGVGASSFVPRPGVTRGRLFFHHGRGHGDGVLWKLLGPAPHKLEGLDLLPARTALASFADIDPAQLADLVSATVDRSGDPQVKQGYEQAMASLSGAAGMPAQEALKSLVGTAGLILTLDPATQVGVPMGAASLSLPRPALALLLPAKDDRIFQQLDKLMAANPGTTRADAPGLLLRTMQEMPITPQIKLKPTLALWGGFLIVASDEQLIRDIIATRTGGHGLASTPEFAALSADLPTQGNGFQVTTRAFADTISRVQAEAMKDQGGIPAQQQALMNKLFLQNAGTATYAISTHLENGWLIASNTVESNPQAASSGGAMGTALLAALAVPAMEKARDKAKTTASTSNERQILIACQMYAADHGNKFPGALTELVPQYLPDQTVLKSPFAPGDATGYSYTAGLNTTSPADSIVVEDAHSAGAAHERVVGHVDGSVQTIPAP